MSSKISDRRKDSLRIKVLSIIILIFYFVYAYAIFINSDLLGDIFSPILVFSVLALVFYEFVITESNLVWKLFGWCITFGLGVWFICDFYWAIQEFILGTEPIHNAITLYGYSFTNLFFLIGLFLLGRKDLKKISKIQIMLDVLVVAFCISILLWLFIFDQDIEKANVLISDPVSMLTLFSDVIIYAWINVWALSTRAFKIPLFEKLIILGSLLFVITDAVYYYVFFYSVYVPNSWIDGAYMIAFTILGLGAYKKAATFITESIEKVKPNNGNRVGIEAYILVVPLFVFIFRPHQIQFVFLLTGVLLIYFVLINYTQKSIFQEKLLEVEKRTIEELEMKVEERTQEIVRILNSDYITGLANRRYFEQILGDTIKNIKRNEKISLIYIDLNGSKAIKYLYGKETASKLLKVLAETIQKMTEPYQSVLSSYADDAFIVMIKGYNADIDASRIADLIILRSTELFHVDNHDIRITISIGVSCYPLDTSEVAELINHSDIAMLQARQKGFNQVQFYNSKIGEMAYSRHKIEMRLKKVKFDEEFVLYYQPQVYCDTGELCGFETLIRWFEGGVNFIPPLDFIPVAEETGVIVDLGYWIMENAAKQHVRWKELTGFEHRISVNVSSKQLVEPDFIQRVHELLMKYHITPKTFEIEITESQQFENSINILETLNKLKSLGVSIAIDDFGTGYSSLYYIKNIPTDRIKIAKELIDRIEDDIYSNSIVQMVINIAKVKGIKVIAEGVETKEQWQCLRDLGCDEIQGYYFSKPLPYKEAEEKWLKKD